MDSHLSNRLTIYLSDADLAKAKREADQAVLSVERWISWLVRDYVPAEDNIDPDE